MFAVELAGQAQNHRRHFHWTTTVEKNELKSPMDFRNTSAESASAFITKAAKVAQHCPCLPEVNLLLY